MSSLCSRWQWGSKLDFGNSANGSFVVAGETVSWSFVSCADKLPVAVLSQWKW